MKGLKQIQKLIQEGRTDELDKIVGTTGSYDKITDSIQTVIHKNEQHSGKPKIHQQLQQIKSQTPFTQLKALKLIAIDLSETLKRKSKETLTKADKKDFHDWFQATMQCMLQIDSIKSSSDSQLSKMAEEALNLFQVAVNSQLADPDLIPYVLLAKTLNPLYELSINPSVSKEIRARLTTITTALCDRFESSEIAQNPAFIVLRKQSLTIHLKLLNPTGISLPSRKTLELLTCLIEIAPTKDNIFLFIKILVNFHGLVDFGDEQKIKQHITKTTEPDISNVLIAYLDGNIEEVSALESNKPIILWLKAMIALNHQFDPEKAERLLAEAASKEDMMHFEQALFYLEHYQSPSSAKLETIQSLLEKSEPKIQVAERPLWLQCNAKINQRLLLEEERKTAPKRSDELQPDLPENKEKNELVEAKPSASPAKEMREAPLIDLSSVMSLAKELIEQYQYQHNTTSSNSGELKEFTVIGWKKKKLPPFEAMKPENRDPIINKLLRHIHICRTFNNLEEEVKCYDILRSPKFMFMLQFERLLEEAAWTLLHCTEDPHSGGFRSSPEERIAALTLAKQLMIICLQHTVKQPEIVFDDQLVGDRITSLTDWLDNIENFGGDQELQQYMRHNIRCRAGSGLGHIFRFIQEATGRSEMEKMASMCFQAKTKFAPFYKPEFKDRIENRENYYRRVTLAR